ncbi:MAG: radical SAM protein [Spirochaetaceae bacterium]|nr:radical SAM protein [Spirochaetaceae bacterium]
MRLITRIDGLPPHLRAGIRPEEAAYLARLKAQGILPFGVTPHFASLAGAEQGDPIRRQFFPSPKEADKDPAALSDPLGERAHQKAPRLIHQYRDRALIRASSRCAGYCRYCFRRIWTRPGRGFILPAEFPPILRYLGSRPEITEALISGGDPLTAPDAALDTLFRALRRARPDLRLRVCTRVPVTCPQRLSPGLIQLLKDHKPLRMAVHINHSRELSRETRDVLGACAGAGIPVLTQTVLLRGVNDDAETLARLFDACLAAGLSLYYLFQLDLAPGTGHFRVDLMEGLRLYEQLERGGAALPVYAVDLPGGGGKIRLCRDAIAGIQGGAYLLKGPGGRLYPYPAPPAGVLSASCGERVCSFSHNPEGCASAEFANVRAQRRKPLVGGLGELVPPNSSQRGAKRR